MSPPFDQILLGVAERTFESLAFLLAVPEASATDCPGAAPAPAAPADAVTAHVVFRGPFCGRLCLSVGRPFLTELAANMLGLAPGEAATDAEQADAFKELANVVCGNLLPEVSGADAVFNIQPPELGSGDDASAAPQQPLAEATLALESGPARLALYVPDIPDRVACSRGRWREHESEIAENMPGQTEAWACHPQAGAAHD